jgi:predicted dehydrogenase
MGMVGGGPGAFIGDVHRRAACLDGDVRLVAGAFSTSPTRSRRKGSELGISRSRSYGSYTEMVERELGLPASERIHFVSIVTPNHVHFPVATAFLEAGFHVVCDKPMTLTVSEARSLKQTVRKTRRVFALTHNYTGYPMVKLARDIVSQGDLGALRKVVVEYPQGWLATRLEETGMKQAAWRTDPARSGGGGCMGDIGTHAENLAEYITGLRVVDVCADLTTFVPGRRLDDDGNVLLRLQKGVRGVLHASQVSVGEDNALSIRVYGERQGIEWHQEEPNMLRVKPDGAPVQVWSRGHDYVAKKSPAAARASRLPAGHPEAFHEAFANVYRNATDTMRARLTRTRPDPLTLDYPTVDDGLRGMLFIEALLKSARSTRKWTRVPAR